MRSYYSCCITRPGHADITVLCHRYAPVVAFATGRGPNGFEFTNDKGLAAAFEGLAGVDAVELLAPLGSKIEAIRSALLPSERKDLDYWKPIRIGDLIFNEWD